MEKLKALETLLYPVSELPFPVISTVLWITDGIIYIVNSKHFIDSISR
jgi:hypothetical protein